MNGYEMQSQAYKDYLESHPEEPADIRANIQKKIKAYDFLAGCDREEIQELFNSSAFNSISKGYVQIACKNLELDNETTKTMLREVSYLFDTVGAEQAEDYYNNH